MNRGFGIAAATAMTAIVFSLVAPAMAHADTFQYAVTTVNNVSFTFTENSLASSGVVTSLTIISDPFTSEGTLGFAWNSSSGPCLVFGLGSSVGPCAAVGASSGVLIAPDSFPSGSFLTTGTFNGEFGAISVTITDISQVPEPSSAMLFGSGALGLLAAIRRKFIG